MKNTCLLITLLLVGFHAAAHAASAPRISEITLVPRSPDNALVPRLTIQSDASVSNLVFYATSLTEPDWLLLTNHFVTQSPYSVLDPLPPRAEARFYRVQVLAPSQPAGIAFIPAGPFSMGNPLGTTEPDELPLHTTFVSAFYMETNLVTQALWDEVYQWALVHDYEFDNPGFGKEPNHPVIEISWHDVLKWCNARSEKESLVPAYWTDSTQNHVYRTGQLDLDSASVKWNTGYRLPTEAEWEKAARGGAVGHNYPWQDSDQFFHDRANVVQNPIFDTGPYPHTSPVGWFPPNGYGLYDMAGNVWEWCWDWYDPAWYENPAAANNDTRGPNSGEYRVLRGGSWSDDYTLARCAKRGFESPFGFFNAYGFRCVKAP